MCPICKERESSHDSNQFIDARVPAGLLESSRGANEQSVRDHAWANSHRAQHGLPPLPEPVHVDRMGRRWFSGEAAQAVAADNRRRADEASAWVSSQRPLDPYMHRVQDANQQYADQIAAEHLAEANRAAAWLTRAARLDPPRPPTAAARVRLGLRWGMLALLAAALVIGYCCVMAFIGSHP